ncbi:OmpA family protein [Burkholderia territorii]|uniref:OmpA family protein n=1 Tax=Burkholderia territorii TaxID=1503055 RepID=UPI001E49AF70|nr:OmpA family protein [Burkholderia territorii]
MKAGLLVIVLTLAGCTAASGPTHNAYTVALPNGEHIYRVTCYGMLEGPGTCRKQAESICKEQPVTLLEAQSGLDATASGKPDDRSILFRCGAPAVALAPSAPAPLPAVTILDADTNFDTDRTELKPSARARLDQLIAESRGATIHSVTVSGYTDSVGSDEYNIALSERRAHAVDVYLQTNGLIADRFISRGYGKAHPIDSNDTASGRSHNRRVEVQLDMDRK